MPTIAVQAHYDGAKVVFDEPVQLPADTRLLVTILPATVSPAPEDEAAWLRSAASDGAFAFLHDTAEDIYTVEDGEPFSDAF